MQNIFSDQNRIKLENNNKKITYKFQYLQLLSNSENKS